MALSNQELLSELSAKPIMEIVELVKMLGRTGSPRAQGVLLPLAKSKSLSLRLAGILALVISR